jgi:hypothetical protein
MVTEMRDAPIPTHVCADERDDTGHCKRCGAKVVSAFERHGRAVKVRHLLAVVDSVIALMPGTPSDEEAALGFARFRREDRARLAVRAGVRPPSDATWLAFLEALRSRRTVAAMEDEPTDIDQVIK